MTGGRDACIYTSTASKKQAEKDAQQRGKGELRNRHEDTERQAGERKRGAGLRGKKVI